ncbi:hypothetical protein [Kordiimonas lacus]|uniref:Uncharacterized protein n=1 Tax=Kordiimonas lacus TaxID=637679 RepID=A0A1G7F695_9PROT|nr:hypothetical protein [Kordiimonas lacus]SDE71468.1 hypothetical protein SAMN04488071_3640 [Kordiimonas lacus]
MTALQGYRELGRRDFAASRFAAFGVGGHQRVVLKKRPVRRVFALPVRGARYLDISFVTDAREMARGAVDVTIRYRGLRKVALRQPVIHRLFADPAPNAGVQRLWLDPPRGAMFVEISFARAVKGQKVALDGQLKLARADSRPNLADFAQVVGSRDLTAMTLLLADLIAEQDRVRARTLLARMCFLSHDPKFAQALSSLDDAERILAFGPNDTAPAAPLGQGIYRYVRSHLDANLTALPLGKALRREARCLVRDLRAGDYSTLHIPAGEHHLGRLLAATMVKRSTPGLKIDMDWEAFSGAPQQLGDWLSFDTGASFLETEGGRAVQSGYTA